MALLHRAGAIDGFTSVQAVRRSKERANLAGSLPPSETAKKGGARGGASGPQKKTPAHTGEIPGAKLARTSVPPRYDLACYECGYAFVLTGHMRDTVCPKCHVELEGKNHRIDSKCSASLKTLGSVEFGPNAVLKGVSVIAGEVILECDTTGTAIKADRRIEVRPGGKFDIEKTETKSFLIRHGARFEPTGQFHCGNIEIEGEVGGSLFCGLVKIRPGGLFRGKLNARRLIVEEGAGLSADVAVGPQIGSAPAEKTVDTAGNAEQRAAKKAKLKQPAKKG